MDRLSRRVAARYQKQADGAWFSNFAAVPRKAMIGNNFAPITFTIDRIDEGRYLLRAFTSGNTKGNVQDCSDTLRFVANDLNDMSQKFFTLGMGKHRVRIVSRSEATFDTAGGLTGECVVDFFFKHPNPRPIFEAAIRPLGSTSLQLGF